MSKKREEVANAAADTLKPYPMGTPLPSGVNPGLDRGKFKNN